MCVLLLFSICPRVVSGICRVSVLPKHLSKMSNRGGLLYFTGAFSTDAVNLIHSISYSIFSRAC